TNNGGRHDDFSFAIDKAQNVWTLNNSGEFQVFTCGDWTNIADQLKQEAKEGYPPHAMAAVGDGSMIYLSNLDSNPTRGFSRYATLEDGKLKLTPAPTCERLNPERSAILRDADGGLWLSVAKTEAMSPTSWRTLGNFTQHVTERGTVEEYAQGFPRLFDADGNAWILNRTTRDLLWTYPIVHSG